jgi:hypothetical protein
MSEKQMKKKLKDKILEIVPAKCDSWIICDVYVFDSWIVCDFVTYLIIDWPVILTYSIVEYLFFLTYLVFSIDYTSLYNILSWWYPRIAILRLFERMFVVCAFGINKWFEFEFEFDANV